MSGEITSDDPHVLALARVSGARLLYTKDNALIRDFKDKKFIDQPRGKVYTRKTNEDLLKTARCVLNS